MAIKITPIKAVLLAVVLLVVVLAIFTEQVVNWYVGPPGEFSAENAPAAPNYDELDYWSAHPDIEDASDLAPEGVATIDSSRAGIDVFFVQPTTLFTGGVWNSNMSQQSFAEQGTEHIIGTMASVFSSCCRIYSPRYRQAHLAAFIRTESPAAIDALDLAYQDVEAAFLHFLANRRNSRPFIVASHSQGTLHALRLLSQHVDGKAIQNKMVAAYLIGYWMPEDALSKTIPNIRLCTRANQSGCVVTYDTYDRDGTGRDPDGVLPYWYPSGWEWANRPKTLCVNPLTWTTSLEKASADLNLGAIPMQWTESVTDFFKDQNPGFRYSSLGAPLEAYTSAQCDADGTLYVDPQKGTQFDNKGAGEDRSLHPNDWNFFHMNLRKNADQRIEAHFDR